MGDGLQEQILKGLKCRICKNYMKSSVFSCKFGHSVCEQCEKDTDTCACAALLTKSRNFALEAVALKVLFPCANKKAGCKVELYPQECLEHEKTCNFKIILYTCPFPNCQWNGYYDSIFHHWRSKRVSKPYGKSNTCHLRLKNNKTFVNLVQAHDQLFWYIFQSHLGKLYWSVQYIGSRGEARNYYYEINLVQSGQAKKRMMLSNYCQPVLKKMKEEIVYGVAIPFDVVSRFIKKDLLIFQFDIYKIDDGDDAQKAITSEQGTGDSLIGACSLAFQNEVPEEMLIDLGSSEIPSQQSAGVCSNNSSSNTRNSSFVEYRIPTSNVPTSPSPNLASPNLIPPLMSLNPVLENEQQNNYSPNAPHSSSANRATAPPSGDPFDPSKDLYPKQKYMYVKQNDQFYPVNYPSRSPSIDSNQNFTPTAPPRNSRRDTRRNSKEKKKSNDDCVIL